MKNCTYFLDSVIPIDYQFNMDILWQEYNRLKKLPEVTGYNFKAGKQNTNKTLDGLHIYGTESDEGKCSAALDEAKKFCVYYGISDSIKVSFMELNKDFNLDWHTDDSNYCKSVVNCLMTENNESLKFRHKEYNYKVAAIDVLAEHKVQNGNNKRIMFRISFQNLTYQELVNDYINKKFKM